MFTIGERMETLTGLNIKNSKIFKDFFEENFSSIVLFADRYLKNIDIATDIAQECFIRLWHSNIDFQSVEKLKGFLYTLARNLSLNQIKHAYVVRIYEQNELLESELFFRDSVIEEETYILMHKAIESLAPQSKKIILLSLQGLSNQEIADKLFISLNSVRTLKQNAYKKLKGLLKDHFYLIFFLLKD